ncbi:MAG: hypothetical protein NVS3B20_16780 [Polyangiales bacterium]
MSTTLRAIADVTTRERILIAGRAGYRVRVGDQADKIGAITAAVGALNQVGARYALIGGVAVGIHSGIPRATLDVDFAVLSTIDRDALLNTMCAHGFTAVGTFAHSLNFRHTSGEPVQLALDPSFDEMLARAETTHADDLEVPIVTKADLIAMKRRAAADPKRRRSKALRDAADVALLEGDVPEPDEGW